MAEKRLIRDEQTIIKEMRSMKIKPNSPHRSLDEVGPKISNWLEQLNEAGQAEREHYSHSEWLEHHDNTVGKWARREEATLEYYGKAKKRLRDVYDLSRLAHNWGMVNGLSLIGGYDAQDQREHALLAGAAIWILDQVNAQGKLYDLLDSLPDQIKVLPRCGDRKKEPIPMPAFKHPDYQLTDIWALIRLLGNRNAELVTPTPFPCSMSDEWTVSRNRKPTDGCPQRKAFEAIMGMLDKGAVQLAAQHFESKVWEFYHLAFHADQFVENRLNAYAREIYSIQERLDSMMHRKSAPYAFSDAFDNTTFLQKNDSPWAQLKQNLEKVQDQAEAYSMKIGPLFCELANPNDREQRLSNFKDEMPTELYEELLHFSVDDPYETCFAVLYLLDAGSNLPWLYYGAMAVTYAAVDQLPFVYHKNIEMPDIALSQEKLNCLHMLRYPAKGKNLAEEADEKLPSRTIGCNLSQLLYDYTMSVWPRYIDCTPIPDNLRNALDQALDDGIDVYQLLLSRLRSEKNFYNEIRWDEMFDQELINEEERSKSTPLDASEEKQRSLVELCSTYQRDIKRLRAECYQSERELKRLRSEHEQLAEQTEHYRMELAELRESVYRAKNSQMQSEDTVEEKSAWPCHTKGKIVSYGGHPTWLNTIRPLLPDVRFIAPDQSPDEQVLHNADSIWLQPNCMSHPDFFKIIRVAGSDDKTVHYFMWNSAEKCAQQLVKAENQ